MTPDERGGVDATVGRPGTADPAALRPGTNGGAPPGAAPPGAAPAAAPPAGAGGRQVRAGSAGGTRPARRKSPRWLRALTVVVVTAVVVAGVTVAVKWSNGAFNGQYQLSGIFTRAGEGLEPSSEVVHRGVQVGRVTSIALVGGRARVTMGIDPSFHVPTDATATIEPINVFGADQVNLTFPSGGNVPRLRPGATIAHTAVSSALGQLFAAADPLLKQIHAGDLETIIANLAQAVSGQGPTIARSIAEGARLAALLDRTLPAQLSALDSFTAFQSALTPTATSLNAIAAANNVALPAFSQHAAQYAALLRNLAPFAQNLAEFLAAYHPDFMTLLSSGDNVARVVIADQQSLGQLIAGLAVYLTKFGAPFDAHETLPNGSIFAYFQVFVLFKNINQLVCSLIAPNQPGLSFLAPLQQALTGAGTPLNCSSQIAAFDAAQRSTAPASTPSAPASGSASSFTANAARQLSTSLYQQLGAPQTPPAPTSSNPVSQILGGLLG